MARLQHIDMQFPIKGLVKVTAFSAQPALSTPDAKNVMVFDNNAERARGGQRPGSKKYNSQLFTGSTTGSATSTTFQALGHGIEVSSTATGYARTQVFFCVVAGTVFAGNTFSLTSTDAVGDTTSGSQAPDTTDVRWVIASDDGEGIGATAPKRYVWFVDGRVYAKLELKSGAYAAADYTEWLADAGTLPIASSQRARLIALWRGRIVLSGLKGEDQNWYMSAVNDPEDWNYAPATTVATQAVAGNNSDTGELADVVTSLFALNDDYLFFGGDSSLWVMRGDPMCGGVLDRITDGVGVAWGDSMAKDPEGNVYWFGSDGNVYMLPSGVFFSPRSLTRDKIDADLRSVNLSTHRVRLQWDTRLHGLWVFISPTTSGSTTHYFWDRRTESWWPVVLPNGFGPLAIHMLDGDAPTDRVMIFGGHDGYIRQFDLASDDDDGTAIDSYVLYTPVVMPENRTAKLIRMTGTPSTNSDKVEYEVRVGDDVQAAVTATATFKGRWFGSGRQPDVRNRARGKALVVRLGNDDNNSEWSMERLAIEVEPAGRPRA